MQGNGDNGSHQGKQEGIHEQQSEPFAQPDAEARDGFDEQKLESLVVGFLRNGGATGPEIGQGQQESGDPEGIGEMEADEAFRGAVAANGSGQKERGDKQQRGKDQHDPGPEGGSQGEQGDGGDLSHGTGGTGCWAARRSTSCKSL